MKRLHERLVAEPLLRSVTMNALKDCGVQEKRRIFAGLLCRIHGTDRAKVGKAKQLASKPNKEFFDCVSSTLHELGCPSACTAEAIRPLLLSNSHRLSCAFRPQDLEDRGACLRAFSFLINLDPSAADQVVSKRVMPSVDDGSGKRFELNEGNQRSASRGRSGKADSVQENSARSASRGRGRKPDAARETSARSASRGRDRADTGEPAKAGTLLPQTGKPPRSSEGRRSCRTQDETGDTEAARTRKDPCQREERLLKESNDRIAKLQREVDEMSALHTQVLAEQQSESLDSRRVLLLKSQNAQLQRQCNIFSSALERRRELVAHCEHTLQEAHDVLKNESYSPAMATQTEKQIAQALTAMRRSSSECDNAPQRLCFFASRFCSAPKSLTLQQVYSGSTEHLDFAAIHQLEAELARLQYDLKGLSASMRAAEHSHASAGQNRVHTQMAQCQRSVDRAAWEIGTLSFLVPSQTRPGNGKSGTGIPRDGSDFVRGAFQAAARQLKQDPSNGSSVLRNLASAVRAYIQINEVERSALEDELGRGGLQQWSGIVEPDGGTAIDQLEQLAQDVALFQNTYAPEDLKRVVTSFEKAHPVLHRALCDRTQAPGSASAVSELCDEKRRELEASLGAILQAAGVDR